LPTSLTPIAILGAGSWGTALALHLSRKGQIVRLWTPDKVQAELMQHARVNKPYLPEQPFPETLFPTYELHEAVKDVRDILMAVPSVGYRAVLTLLKPYLTSAHRILCATKGLDTIHGQLLHAVAADILGENIPFAVLSGPSFAKEVAAALPTAIVIASRDHSFSNDLLDRFNSKRFRVYLSTDIIGVEIGGVIKNILAIATGISDGMGFGANARSALITRGLAEMMRLGEAVGGQQSTFQGLAGLGDLILTCTDDQSRNRQFGLYLGKGKSPEEALALIGQVVEGKQNAPFVVQLAQKNQVEMPIVEAVFNILQGHMTPTRAMEELLSRAPRGEG